MPVAYCPVCKAAWEDGTTECQICGRELQPDLETSDFVVIGSVSDQVTADFAREVLESCEIPAIVRSRSGFFGTVGLTLPSFYNAGAAQFELMAPESLMEEANEVLGEALGDRWQKKEK